MSVKETILFGTNSIGLLFITSLSVYWLSHLLCFASQYIPDGTVWRSGILCNSHCCFVYSNNCNFIIFAVISDTLSLSTLGTNILKSSISSIIPEWIARLLNNSLNIAFVSSGPIPRPWGFPWDIPIHTSLLSPRCENSSLACSILFPFNNANKNSKYDLIDS